MKTHDNYIPLQVDVISCEEEQIHIPGLIQPHGVLLVLKEPELTILQISNNAFNFFNQQPEQLLNQPLSNLFHSEQIDCIKSCLFLDNLHIGNFVELTITLDNVTRKFDGIIHRCSGSLILELEPSISEKTYNFSNLYSLIKQSLIELNDAINLMEICEILAQTVKKTTDFDRVIIYQFHDDLHGNVIAEVKEANVPSYLGLHFPAFDIPLNARKLYSKNWLRLIPDINYQPVAIIPSNQPLTNQPLDLSISVLRSVSSAHIKYIQNMGIQASMSISIMKNKELWGLIACHHQLPKYIPYEIRNMCEFMGQIASAKLTNKEDDKNSQYKMYLKSVESQLIDYMSADKNSMLGLINYQPNLLDLVNAQGAIVCFNDEFYSVGNTPNQEDIQKLETWINQNIKEEIFYTNQITAYYPEAEKFSSIVSGLLAIFIHKTKKNYILWFRPEVLQTINWAGNPNQSIEISDQGSLVLSPRKSFDLWKETVRLKSLPWEPDEVNAAAELRNSIINRILQKVDELSQLNVELERRNQELDTFAYIASHDLKEPLRGIHNYANFLIEDYEKIIDDEGKHKLKTLMRLTQGMEELINSLLLFSRLGRVDLNIQPTDMDSLVRKILDLLSARIDKVDIRIPRPLPTVNCDHLQVGEVFNNLITNAIKYNDKAEKWIEIGYIDQLNQAITFYVRDNGIGIREKHLQTIFRIFKRLHAQSKYGGGTGSGLTMVKKIIERHGGTIWVESIYGQGSTFYFNFQRGEQ